MLPDEKNRLLTLFESGRCWCQDAEARDAYGNPVKFHDPLASAWDITGAMCCLFGWRRACTLFGQLERHIYGRRRVHRFRRNAPIESMVTLQVYNDHRVTAFEGILALLETIPVWTGVLRPTNASARLGANGRSVPSQRRKSLETITEPLCQDQELPRASVIASSRNEDVKN